VDDLAESATATKAYIETVRAIAENRLGATVSVKLSQLGIGLDPAVCAGHLDELLRAAAEVGVPVEVDMEHSSVGRRRSRCSVPPSANTLTPASRFRPR
jgi:proline dehydrogenase